ncbi:MAG: cation transporter [Bernardetiaceae bacterium]|nr:cation transporter [Bernardetiaceae bacterium]
MKYKTNLKCAGCVAKIAPLLDAQPQVEKWETDLESPDKVLTVHGSLSPEQVKALLQQAGFKAEAVQ